MGSPPPAPNQKMPMKFLASKHYMIITSDQLLRFSPPNSAYKVAPCSTETTLPWITCDMTLIIILRNFGVRKERNLSCLESTDEIVPNLDSLCPPWQKSAATTASSGHPVFRRVGPVPGRWVPPSLVNLATSLSWPISVITNVKDLLVNENLAPIRLGLIHSMWVALD